MYTKCKFTEEVHDLSLQSAPLPLPPSENWPKVDPLTLHVRIDSSTLNCTASCLIPCREAYSILQHYQVHGKYNI